MNEESIIRYIVDTFDGVELQTSQGDHYFFYGPERMFPIVTLVTGDNHDTVSLLSRPGVYRLNIGVGKQTFRSHFGEQPMAPGPDGETPGGYDFSALDLLLPHPVYGKMYWVCILNPSTETFKTQVQPLLVEAYEQAVAKQARREARTR